MGLFQRLLGDLAVLWVQFESTDRFTVCLYVLKLGRKGGYQVFRQIADPDAKDYKASCVGHVVLISVVGHGVITKSTAETAITEKVTSSPEHFAWSITSEEAAETISFVRRDQLVGLQQYLLENHIVFENVIYGSLSMQQELEVCRIADRFCQEVGRWRILLHPSVQSSLIGNVFYRRLRLPVLVGLLLLLVGNTFIYSSLNDRYAAQQTLLSAQKKTQGETQQRSQQRSAAVAKFSHRLSVSHALLMDRVATHVPLAITLTDLAVQPLSKSLEENKQPIYVVEELVVKGVTNDAGAVSTFIRGLKSEPLLRDARLNHLTQRRDNTLTEFEITVAL